MIELGTTGWDFDNATLDSFYPKAFKDNKLKYYASISPLVELYSTYYVIPNEDVVDSWNASTPKHFDFVGRMHRSITNNKRKTVNTDMIEQYFSVMNRLKYKLGIVLLHFDKSFEKNRKNTEFVVNILDEINNHYNGHISIEFLNNSWYREDNDFYEQMIDKSSSMISTDKRIVVPKMRHPDIFYLRLRGDYSLVPEKKIGTRVINRDNDIKYYAKYLKSLRKRYKMIYVTVDNHFSGNCIEDAFQLGTELRAINVRFKGFSDRTSPLLKPKSNRKRKIKQKAKNIADNEQPGDNNKQKETEPSAIKE